MADMLNLANQYSAPILPAEPNAGRKGWKVVFEVVVVLLLASALIAWFAVVRNQSSVGSLFPSKEQLMRLMTERPAVSLTNTQKQQLFAQMVKPAPVTVSKTVMVNGKATTVKTTTTPKVSKTLSKVQRAELLQKMVAGQ